MRAKANKRAIPIGIRETYNMVEGWKNILPSFEPIRSAVRETARDPRFVFDMLYWVGRGISVRNLDERLRTETGALVGLATLAKRTGPAGSVVPLASLRVDDDRHIDDLGELLAKYGSDKAARHEYHKLYGYFLGDWRDRALSLLEIGIGTRNPTIPSNMGKYGQPGASLRAFRDWGQQFNVFGADIDSTVLFQETRINTFLVDQRDNKSLQLLASNFDKHSIDIIIDDGLHEPWANINTLNLSFDLLKPGGFLFIEDIREEHLRVWDIASCLLSRLGADWFDFRLVRCRETYVFVLQALNGAGAAGSCLNGLP